jgi:hypothetical protein
MGAASTVQRSEMRKSFAVTALLFFAACGGSYGSSTVPSTSVAGTYTLRTVNGLALPYIVSQTGPSKVEVVDDAFTLNDSGTWTESGHRRNTVSGQVTTTATADAGSFTISGTTITMSSLTTGALYGSVASGTLSLTEQGALFVYMR